MKTSYLTVFPTAILLGACASLFQGDRASMPFAPGVQKEVEALVQRNEFSAARSRVLQEKARGPWCEFFNKEDFCYNRSPASKPDALLKWVNTSEECFNTLFAAEKPVETREEASQIQDKLYKVCNFQGVPTHLEKRLKSAEEKLSSEMGTGRFRPQLANGATNPAANAQNQCLEGLRWGYYALGEIKNSRNEPVMGAWGMGLEHLKGEFKTKDECEEARLEDSTARNHPFDSGGCKQRYLGKSISVEVTELGYMVEVSGSIQKATLYFSSTSECERARSTGLQYTNADRGLKLNILPAGEKQMPRFMGQCKKTDESICKPHQAEPALLDVAR